jgi:hypothetical protein
MDGLGSEVPSIRLIAPLGSISVPLVRVIVLSETKDRAIN